MSSDTPRTDEIQEWKTAGAIDAACMMHRHAKRLERELADMTADRDSWEGQADTYVTELIKLQDERDGLCDTVADIREQTKIIMDERCATDEVHCTCVPILRARVKRLEDALNETITAVAQVRLYTPLGNQPPMFLGNDPDKTIDRWNAALAQTANDGEGNAVAQTSSGAR